MRIPSRTSILAAGLLGFALTGLAANRALAASSGSASDIARGRAAFMQDGCYTCHGTVAQGNRFSGPALAPHLVAYAGFLKQLRAPAHDMPAYAPTVLSDADAAAIYAYLRSIPVGKPASAIPLLESVRPATGNKP